MVGFALIVSWIVAVTFTPYLGVRLLPDIKPVPGGREAIYASRRYQRLRALVRRAIAGKWLAASAVVAAFLISLAGMGLVKQQFFPVSERPELIAEIYMPEGSSIEATDAAARKVEQWVRAQPEAKVVTTYIGQGAPRFFLSLSPELPDPAFAKLIILTPDAKARDALKARLRAGVAAGLAPQARVRVTQLLFGPPVPYPVSFRVGGPDLDQLRKIAESVAAALRANPHMRQVNLDWGDRAPTAHFVLDQARLRAIGLDPQSAAEQLQFLLNGAPVTQVREDIANRRGDGARHRRPALRPSRLSALSLATADGRSIPLDQLGQVEFRPEDPILKRRDRVPTITVRGDIDERLQPAEVNAQVEKGAGADPGEAARELRHRHRRSGRRSGQGERRARRRVPDHARTDVERDHAAVRSFAAMAMVFLTAPLGLIGAVPTLLLFHQPFGFNAILGMIGLGGILMRNTLILIGQIHDNMRAGLSTHDAVVEATVQRARPVLLTALCSGAGVHPPDDVQLLGADGVRPDRRHSRRHGADAAVPARPVRDLVRASAAPTPGGRRPGFRRLGTTRPASRRARPHREHRKPVRAGN